MSMEYIYPKLSSQIKLRYLRVYQRATSLQKVDLSSDKAISHKDKQRDGKREVENDPES